MPRRVIPGGTYVEALPSGEYAALIPHDERTRTGGWLQTHLGRIDLPPNDEPLFLRITNRRGFKIAGSAHYSSRTLEWVRGQRIDHPPACGVSPVIYDHAGFLTLSECGPVGSQGFRFVDADGRIWTGDETYGSPFGLSEWSAYGGLTIGQGHDGGGVRVWDGAQLRVLDEGDCRFIRVRGDGERVAVSYWQIGVGSVIVQTTLSELRALPVVSAPSPPPVPVPVPPKEPPVSLPDPGAVKAALQRERDKYPERVTNDQCGAIINAVALQFPDCGMHRKTGGEFATLPNGEKVNRNVIRYLPAGDDFGWWSDVLEAAGVGIASPQAPSWQRSTDNRNSFVPPVGVVTPPAPVPQPTPVPQPPPNTTLEQRVAKIEANQAADAANDHDMDERLARIEAWIRRAL